MTPSIRVVRWRMLTPAVDAPHSQFMWMIVTPDENDRKDLGVLRICLVGSRAYADEYWIHHTELDFESVEDILHTLESIARLGGDEAGRIWLRENLAQDHLLDTDIHPMQLRRP